MAGHADPKKVTEYNKNAYDNVLVRVPKGTKDVWQTAADNAEMSLNNWVVTACNKVLGDSLKKAAEGYNKDMLKLLKPETRAFVEKKQKEAGLNICKSITGMLAKQKHLNSSDDMVDMYIASAGAKKFNLKDTDKPLIKDIMDICIERTSKKR